MIFDLLNLDHLHEFIGKNKAVYFRLTGGLGNQLFGLSEAYGIHKKIGTRVAIDIGALEHVEGSEPEWMDWSVTQSWIVLVRIPKNVSAEFDMVNLGEESSTTNPISAKLYTGWIFSLERVRKIGLFHQGSFPFKPVDAGQIGMAVHYRVGDYSNAQGIGVLETQYYKKAINSIEFPGQIVFFSDDNQAARNLIQELNLGCAEVGTSNKALDVVSQISNAKCIVAANSTLSWWGIYFSRAEKVICPTPFYFQDWNFDHDARFKNALYLSRFKNFCQAISTWIRWRIRSLRIKNKL